MSLAEPSDGKKLPVSDLAAATLPGQFDFLQIEELYREADMPGDGIGSRAGSSYQDRILHNVTRSMDADETVLWAGCFSPLELVAEHEKSQLELMGIIMALALLVFIALNLGAIQTLLSGGFGSYPLASGQFDTLLISSLLILGLAFACANRWARGPYRPGQDASTRHVLYVLSQKSLRICVEMKRLSAEDKEWDLGVVKIPLAQIKRACYFGGIKGPGPFVELIIDRPEKRLESLAHTKEDSPCGFREFIDSLLGRKVQENRITTSEYSAQTDPLCLNEFTQAELKEFVIQTRSLGLQCYPKFT